MHLPSHASSLGSAIALLASFQAPELGGQANDLKVQDFIHGGKPIRGLSTRHIIHDGDTFLKVPAELTITTARSPEMKQARFKDLDSVAQIAFWLVEQRAKQKVQQQCFSPSVRDRFISKYIKSLPTPDELRSRGLSQYASLRDVKTLLRLPAVDVIGHAALDDRRYLLDQLRKYNAQRGHRPEITLSEAVWGDAVASSYSFECNDSASGKAETALVPVAEFVNHAEGPAENTTFDCKDGRLELKAIKKIEPGQEILIPYRTNDDPELLLADYGIVKPNPAGSWTLEECELIKKANVGERPGDSPFLQLVRDLAETNCATLREHTMPLGPRKVGAVATAGMHPFFAISPSDCDYDPGKHRPYYRLIDFL